VSRRGIALLVVLIVIVLAAAALAAALATVNLEIGATRATVAAARGEVALLDLREGLLADSVTSGLGGSMPAAWRTTATSTVMGVGTAITGGDTLVWLNLSSRVPTVRNMMMVMRLVNDTGGWRHLRPLDRRATIIPFF
jgi:hypothetical protein